MLAGAISALRKWRLRLPPVNEIETAESLATKGGLLVAFFVLGGLIWMAVAPLNGAALATGYVVVAGNRKTIQHLEGGQIKAIHVKEGDIVKEGDELIALDRTQAEASVAVLHDQYLSQLAIFTRLSAEQDITAGAGADHELVFPDELSNEKTSPAVAEIMLAQGRQLENKRHMVSLQSGILENRKEQYVKAIGGFSEQRKSATRQLELINVEKKTVETLISKGLERMPRLLALQRNEAELVGKVGDIDAQAARSEVAKSELDIQVLNLLNQVRTDAANELKDVQPRLIDLRDKLVASRDILEKTIIRAPVNGIVVGLQFHTIGAVVRAAEPILDIVPNEERLVIEVQVQPDDIDVVKAGVTAQIIPTAYKQRTMPYIVGKVQTVSADHPFDFNEPIRLAPTLGRQRPIRAGAQLAQVRHTTLERLSHSWSGIGWGTWIPSNHCQGRESLANQGDSRPFRTWIWTTPLDHVSRSISKALGFISIRRCCGLSGRNNRAGRSASGRGRR